MESLLKMWKTRFAGYINKALSACDTGFPAPPRAVQLTLRLVFALSFIYLFPVYTMLGHKKPVAPPQFAEENGMGGGYSISDYEEAAASLGGSDPAVVGMPEPESFSRPGMLVYNAYTVQKGDMVGLLAQQFGLNEGTLFSVNNIRNSRSLQIGHVLKVPNQDGIVYTVKKGETLSGIAEKYKTGVPDLQTVNELFSNTVHEGTVLFIPGAQLDMTDIQERNGDLFNWPVRGVLSSLYGYRKNPFGGARQFHSGLDIAAALGTPVRSALPGRISAVGYDPTFGNYVVITHHSGYRTLYAHMSVVRVKSGTFVGAGERIGDVGTTGVSTGPHLHFTVYKNGVTVNPRNLIK